MEATRLFAHIHGHLGWLAAVALVHPAIVLRRPSRKAHIAVGLATGIATASAALGMCLYVPYRERLRRGIYAESPAYGLLFERKEHLAFAAVLLAWAGAAAYVGGHPKIAFRSYVASSVFAIAVATLGTAVAAFRSF